MACDEEIEAWKNAIDDGDGTQEACRRKKEVGNVDFNSNPSQYYRNALYVLSAISNPTPEQQAKIDWLKEHGYGG